MEQKFFNRDIPCPPNWGGFHVLPIKIEFWFGREGRLHDRYVYYRSNVSESNWLTTMVSP